MKHITSAPKEVRKFGLTFSILSFGAAVFFFSKGSSVWIPFLGGSLFFLSTGLWAYPVLKPIYVGWMSFAFALGWINTRIILGLVFLLVFTPVGLVIRMLGKDPLRLRFDRQARSYWVKRKPQRFNKRYEQLF